MLANKVSFPRLHTNEKQPVITAESGIQESEKVDSVAFIRLRQLLISPICTPHR